MNTDTVRRQAHRVASRCGDANPNYNPFARVRSHETHSDVESQVHRTRSTRSEAHATPAIEEQRRLERINAEKEFAPHHHDTDPVAFSAGGAAAAEHTLTPRHEATEDSSGSTITESTRQNSTGITKRVKFKNMFGKKHNAEEDAELEQTDSEQLSMEERRKKALKRKLPVGKQIRYVLFGAWINVLLIMVPVGFAVFYAHLSPVVVFIVNFIAIIPLAAMLSNATEELAIRVGETMGGLLNATFG